MLIKKQLKKVKFSCVTFFIFFNDLKRYLNATGYGASNTDATLIYKLRKDYHKIEKGFTMLPRREFFGLKVLDNILYYIDKINDKSSPEVIKALNVIEKYLEEHSYDPKLNKYTVFIEQFQFLKTEEDSGYYNKAIGECTYSENELKILEHIITKRRTTRHFSKKLIQNEVFNSVFNIARFTPSACNRQSWGVKVVKNIQTIDDILSLQNGNSGFKEEICHLIVITADLSSCISPEERKQVWFDSGLFSMNLINTLHTNSIGSCCLNWCVGLDKEKKIQHILNLNPGQVVTVLLAVGYYKETFFVCDSPKKSIAEFVEYL